MDIKIPEEIQKIVTRFYSGNQSAFSRDLNVSPQAVQKWVAGTNYPKVETLAKISEITGVPLERIIFGSQVGNCQSFSTPFEGRRNLIRLVRILSSLPEPKIIALIDLLSD